MKKMILTLLVLSLTIYGNIAMADPAITNVTGTISDGQSVTITGTDFGTHDRDIEWIGGADGLIETSTTGQTPSNTGGWIFNQGVFENQIIATSQAHSGSKSLYCDTSSAFRYDYGSSIAASQIVYVSWWIRINHTGDGQHKLFRLNWQNDIQDDYPQIVMFNWYNANQMYTRPGNTISANVTQQYPSYPDVNGRWYRMEFLLTESSIGTSDGKSVVSLHDPESGISVKVSTKSNVMTYLNEGRLHRWFLWQNYLGNGLSGETWIDDVYIQVGTQARVEIADSPTWVVCTQREIQIPTAWSSDGTSITATVNRGSFIPCKTYYLFVVDANGVPSAGYPVTIGSGVGDNPPNVNITSPTTASTYTTSENTIDIAGTASDDDAISSITWSNNRGGSGSANNDSGDWTSWSIDSISLQEDTNAVAVTVTDSANQASTKTIAVIYNSGSNVPSAAGGLGLLAWQATEQTGDTNWKNSVVTYCVRLLIDESYVKDSGDTVQLTFQGRSSGDYTIKKVSIAERDLNGNQGDVIDPTWTRVTFDGHSTATWDNDIVVVPAGTKKKSNPIEFPINSGKDYYVTFKIETPSVYLDPPSGYQELYFPSDDHTSNIDWSSIGYSTAQDYHGLASIVVINQ